jgi:hypothetical protein
MPLTTRGMSELTLRFDQFPRRLHDRLESRIRELTNVLEGHSKAAAPVKTGALRGEISSSVYSDNPERIAGYVSVRTTLFAKAATLEYGSDKPRNISEHSAHSVVERLFGGKSRIDKHLSKPVHIKAFQYLHGPLEQMRPEVEASLNEVVAQAAAEGGS